MKHFLTLFLLLFTIIITSACENAIDANVEPLQKRLDDLTAYLEELLNKPIVKEVYELEEKLHGWQTDLENNTFTPEEIIQYEDDINKIKKDLEELKADPEYQKINQEINDLSDEIKKLIDEIGSL